MAWVGPSAPVDRPLAVFVDEPGGPLDLLATDPDVATFLNDRFHPWFLVPSAVPGLPDPPAAILLDAQGCVRAAPFRPADPAAWIAAANAALLEIAAGVPGSARLPELAPTFPLSADHPLRGRCPGAAAGPG